MELSKLINFEKIIRLGKKYYGIRKWYRYIGLYNFTFGKAL